LQYKTTGRALARRAPGVQWPFEFSRIFSSSKDDDSRHTNPYAGKTTGGQTRCEEAEAMVLGKGAGRGNAVRYCELRNPRRGIRQILGLLRMRWGSVARHARTRAAKKQSASLAWSCSNPDHGERVSCNAWTCSTASPVVASSRRHSRMHIPQERLPVPPKRLACGHALFTNFDAKGVAVKRVLRLRHELPQVTGALRERCLALFE
jgi:hypothetical protein